jgi:hypothetical protein
MSRCKTTIIITIIGVIEDFIIGKKIGRWH